MCYPKILFEINLKQQQKQLTKQPTQHTRNFLQGLARPSAESDSSIFIKVNYF